eukprot:TRINITY_DN9812_c0_g1_i1.p1 TRINITY_DN9812_c0_g1~~TRINITY_DN9812_c0_g1_i1.p1  ORF type:complete len:400 (+),score=47.87 TRINITY_DN9812_c0_g1_i1:80-1279(+)
MKFQALAKLWDILSARQDSTQVVRPLVLTDAFGLFGRMSLLALSLDSDAATKKISHWPKELFGLCFLTDVLQNLVLVLYERIPSVDSNIEEFIQSLNKKASQVFITWIESVGKGQECPQDILIYIELAVRGSLRFLRKTFVLFQSVYPTSYPSCVSTNAGEGFVLLSNEGKFEEDFEMARIERREVDQIVHIVNQVMGVELGGDAPKTMATLLSAVLRTVGEQLVVVGIVSSWKNQLDRFLPENHAKGERAQKTLHKRVMDFLQRVWTGRPLASSQKRGYLVSCPKMSLYSANESYLGLITQWENFVCARCKTEPDSAAICLLCGTFLCVGAKTRCCQSFNIGECSVHAQLCGRGVSIILMLSSSLVEVVRDGRVKSFGVCLPSVASSHSNRLFCGRYI